MPNTQVASVPNYDFGIPVTLAQVGLFMILRGAKVDFRFDNVGGTDVTVSINVCDTLTGSFVATTAAANIVAVSAVVVQASCVKEFNVLLRPGKDNYIQVTGSSAAGGRVTMQARNAGGRCLEPLNCVPGTTAPIQTPTGSTV